MATWTTPKTWVAGSALTAAELNEQVRDDLTWVKDALTVHGITSDTTPQAIKSDRYGVSMSGDDTAADATDAAISFGNSTEEYDDAGFHSENTNTSRITIPTGGAGTYVFTAWVSFESNATGRREAWIEKNGATSYNRTRIATSGAGATTAFTVSCDIRCQVGDYFVVRVRQNSGSTLNVSARFQARRVAV
jgi:hypothetical protein